MGKGGTGTFTISLSKSMPQDCPVNYAMSGNAIVGTDYMLSGSPNQVIIPTGQTSATVTLTVITTKTKGREKAVMTLTTGSGYQFPTAGKKHRTRTPSATVKINNR
jgi:hypothetical protein